MESKYYIHGVGMTKFGVQDETTHEMAYKAAIEALEGSSIKMSEIDAIVVSNTDTIVNGERQRHFNSMLKTIFHNDIPIIRTPAVCGGGGVALWTALSINYDNVLVIGADKIMGNTTQIITDQILEAADKVWEQSEGMIFPAQNALVAQQHFMKYGSNPDDLALISYKNHHNGKLNPKAKFYQKEVSIGQIKSSPMVASPLRLFDCSISVNGAAACIISKEKSDIEIAGKGLALDTMATFERDDITSWDATKIAAEKAYKEAKIQPDDINIAEIHDAFTIVELISYEDLGFCKKGQGSKMIRDGIVNLDGKLPVNTSGGLKARGHPISPTGLAQIYELAKQMRNQAENRQVSNIKYGLAQNIGGAGGTITVHVLKHIGG